LVLRRELVTGEKKPWTGTELKEIGKRSKAK
jgi:hypothetical protein